VPQLELASPQEVPQRVVRGESGVGVEEFVLVVGAAVVVDEVGEPVVGFVLGAAVVGVLVGEVVVVGVAVVPEEVVGGMVVAAVVGVHTIPPVNGPKHCWPGEHSELSPPGHGVPQVELAVK
jgi:hypothetical protein